jgi:hypothetical protein
VFLIKIEATPYGEYITPPRARMSDDLLCEVCFRTKSPVEVHRFSCGCCVKGHISCVNLWLTVPGNGCIVCRNATIYLHDSVVRAGSPLKTIQILRITIPSEVTESRAKPWSFKLSYLTYAPYDDEPSPDAAILQRQSVVVTYRIFLKRDCIMCAVIASLLATFVYVIYIIVKGPNNQ